MVSSSGPGAAAANPGITAANSSSVTFSKSSERFCLDKVMGRHDENLASNPVAAVFRKSAISCFVSTVNLCLTVVGLFSLFVESEIERSYHVTQKENQNGEHYTHVLLLLLFV